MGKLPRETKRSRERQFKYFIELLPKLQVEEFFGVLRLFNIQLLQENSEPREFLDLYEELLDKFIDASKEARFNIIYVMEAALSKDDNTETHKSISYK